LLTIPGKFIPFGAKHPEVGLKDKDIETILNRGIEIAGIMGDVWIDRSGRPK